MQLSSFDRVEIINLPSRSDRRRQMRRQLPLAGLREGGNVGFFPAIRPAETGPFRTVGEFGSFLSHAAVVRAAADAGASLLVLEDDCNFLPEAKAYRIPPCDVFYGSHAADADTMIGAHCMGFSARAVQLLDAYLLDYLSPEFKADPKASLEEGYNPSIRPPIDGAYVWFRRAHPQLLTHFAMLTYQRPSRSDCTPSHLLDRIPIVKDAVEIARQLRAIGRRQLMPGRS